jgi:hypothetical protein
VTSRHGTGTPLAFFTVYREIRRPWVLLLRRVRDSAYQRIADEESQRLHSHTLSVEGQADIS